MVWVPLPILFTSKRLYTGLGQALKSHSGIFEETSFFPRSFYWKKSLGSVSSSQMTSLEGPMEIGFYSNPKDRQCQRMFKLPHNHTHFTCQQGNAQNSLSQASSSTSTENFQMYKLDLGKAEEPEIKLPTSVGSQTKMQGNSRGSLGNACCSPPRSQSWGHANFPFQAYGVSELHASPWQPLVLQCVARAIPCPGPVTFRGSGFLRVGRVALQWKGRFSLRVMLVAQDP